MIRIRREGILLQRSGHSFEMAGVMNPGVYQEGLTVHLFYRAVGQGGISTIGYCRLDGPLQVVCRRKEPIIVPECPYESWGVEDPRIVRIDGKWYLTYTAYDGSFALGALATSEDLITFKKQGVVVPRLTYSQLYALIPGDRVDKRYVSYADDLVWNKNLIFFSRRIRGKLFFLHRIRPGILIAAINDLSELNMYFWERYFSDLDEHILLDPLYAHESLHIGGGCPPVETGEGWLLIYHGIEEKDGELIYSACAALLDGNDPRHVIARLPFALFLPEESWEKTGVTANVVFPTGTAVFGQRLYVYYGSADYCIGVVSMDIQHLLRELLAHACK